MATSDKSLEWFEEQIELLKERLAKLEGFREDVLRILQGSIDATFERVRRNLIDD